MEKEIKFWPAIILAILCGWFGLQEFYVGNIIRGFLALLFCWTGIPAIIAFIQCIIWIFKGEAEFDKKYNHKYGPLNS